MARLQELRTVRRLNIHSRLFVAHKMQTTVFLTIAKTQNIITTLTMNNFNLNSTMACPMNKQRHNAQNLWRLPKNHQNATTVPVPASGTPEHRDFTAFRDRAALHDITNAMVGQRVQPRESRDDEEHIDPRINRSQSEDRESGTHYY